MQWVPPVLFGAGCLLGVVKGKKEDKDDKDKDEEKKETKQRKPRVAAKPGWNLLAEIAKEEKKKKKYESSDETTDGEEDEETEEETEECEESEESGEDLKMVMVVRKDLKMQTGKMCAQCCHACVGVLQKVLASKDGGWLKWYHIWNSGGSAKIALKANSEEELLQVRKDAQEVGLPCYIVRDAGRTQIPSGSKTVIAVGPAPISLVDKVTEKFKLL